MHFYLNDSTDGTSAQSTPAVASRNPYKPPRPIPDRLDQIETLLRDALKPTGLVLHNFTVDCFGNFTITAKEGR